MKLQTKKLGGQMGIVFCLAGMAAIWSGWNGAATYNDLRKQFPYLISGGITGLALVMIGVGLFVVQSARADRVQLEANLTELRKILDRLSGAPGGNGQAATGDHLVVAGPNAYHRPTCRLVEGREGLSQMPRDAAVAAGLTPCRTCGPDTVETEVDLEEGGSRKARKAPAAG